MANVAVVNSEVKENYSKKKEVKEIEFSLPSNPYFLGCFSIFLDGFWHSRKCKILVVKEQDTRMPAVHKAPISVACFFSVLTSQI